MSQGQLSLELIGRGVVVVWGQESHTVVVPMVVVPVEVVPWLVVIGVVVSGIVVLHPYVYGARSKTRPLTLWSIRSIEERGGRVVGRGVDLPPPPPPPLFVANLLYRGKR